MKEAKVLKMTWGNKPCNHPQLEIERDDIGMSTGDYVCTTCGQEGWGSGWNEQKPEKTEDRGTNQQPNP
ncbi:MAG: hypothetical protein KBH45_13280 [Verrucomicrobia bacterium]|nr:hypothetical protein [Verrucomicrobiota bacterium]